MKSLQTVLLCLVLVALCGCQLFRNKAYGEQPLKIILDQEPPAAVEILPDGSYTTEGAVAITKHPNGIEFRPGTPQPTVAPRNVVSPPPTLQAPLPEPFPPPFQAPTPVIREPLPDPDDFKHSFPPVQRPATEQTVPLRTSDGGIDFNTLALITTVGGGSFTLGRLSHGRNQPTPEPGRTEPVAGTARLAPKVS